MINVSDAFKQKLQDGERVWQEVEITFPDGTVKTVKNEIMGENCTFSDCAESSSFPIGCVVCKSMTLELDNTSDQWKNYNFYMAKVHAYLKMQTSVASLAATDELLDENYEPILDQSGGAILATKAATEDRVETIDKGIYTITTPEQYGEILSFTALDDMYKTNATYISHLVLPQSIETLVRDACETLGIPSEVSMAHGNLIVSEIPENMTFRQLFGWAAMLETANARLDSRGYLRFIRWDFSNTQEDYNAVVDADGNVTFKGGASIDSESFISPTGNWTIDSDGFLTLIESATDTSEKLKDFFTSPTVSSDDIVITGIKLKNRENETMYGSAGYVLELENDLVADSDLDTVAAQIGDSIIGVKFRNMSGELAYNPLIEFGDMAYTYDRKWNRYITPLTDVSCSVNGKTAVKTQADDPIRGMSKFVSDGTKAIVEARRLVKIEKTEREKAVERLAGMLASSGGLYMTEEPQEDGSTIYYMHNKPTLEESDIIWKLTAEAFAVSVDGGKTYPYGLAVTGELITRLLYAEGINADYINAGTFVVRDKNGKVIFMADMETGSVKIDASYVQIGGSALDKALDDMQGQIDGNIETWTGKDEPTLDNYPAKNWLTDEEKSKHVGDVYYDSKNQGYRFRNDGQGYGWQMVKDTDITKALQDAAEAKESAANAEKAAALARNMTLQLSNDMQTIASDADGNIPTFPTVATAATVMYGTQDITDDCSFTITKSTSVTGSWNDSTHTYTVTGLSADNGWVDIKVTYLRALSIAKRFTIAKLKAGKNGLQGEKGDPGSEGKPGRTYMIEPSCTVLKRGADKVISPNFLEFNAYYRDGDSATRYAYSGRFVIEETADGNTWKTIYTSSANETSVKHYLYTVLTDGNGQTITDGNGTTLGIPRDVTNIRCKLYAAGGITDMLDMQSVAVVIDVDNLTQTDIVNILSNNGAWKGLYYKNGQLYISFSAALGGELALGGANNGNGILAVYDESGNISYKLTSNGNVFYNETGQCTAAIVDGKMLFPDTPFTVTTGQWSSTQKGFIYGSKGLNRFSGRVYGNTDGTVKFDYTTESFDGYYEPIFLLGDEINGFFNVLKAKQYLMTKELTGLPDSDGVVRVKVTSAIDILKTLRLYNLTHVSSGGHLVLSQDGATVAYLSSSSKRYKTVQKNLECMQQWYDIEPVWAKYKDGYLADDDIFNGKNMPMFLAEDVEKNMPEAAVYKDGKIEDWNYRVMIPAMFAMLKQQKSEIDSLKQELDEVKQFLRKE